MERIMIVGCSGSGKSTLASNLSQVLNIDLMHLDAHSWAAGWISAPKDQFEKAHEDFIKKDKWIIDGNCFRVIDERLERADTIIHLDISRMSCVYGIIKWRIQFHGKTRPGIAENCPEQIDWEHLKCVWKYKDTKYFKTKKMLAEQKEKNKKIIVLKSRNEVDVSVEEVKKSVRFEKSPESS